MSKFQVYENPCQNCLLSKDRIVPAKRAKEIIEGCKQGQSHFICHKSSMNDGQVCCRTFFDKFGHFSQMIRICEGNGAIEFVTQTDSEKLTPYRLKKIER